MNYELAKQLKEAGFPHTRIEQKHILDEGWLSPTLEELIEAIPLHCGLEQKDFGWCMYVKGIINENTIAETPTEAVAKLWLELNKK